MSAVDVNREGRLGWFGYLDWGAILASVFAGLGTTLLLVAFGSAVGIEAADDGGDETRISSIVGTWTVVSALLGTLWARSSAAGTAAISRERQRSTTR